MNDYGRNLLQIQGDQDVQGSSDQGIYTPYQYIVKLNVFPQSDKFRFLVKHPTGSGKTTTGLLVAQNFYKERKQVLIITFNAIQFQNELMNITDLGFISKQEQFQMNDPQQRHTIQLRVLRRVRQYVTIVGYKEFSNLLLGPSGDSLSQFMLDKYKNGVVICDEIHNAYKRDEQNSYGLAIQVFNAILQKQVYMVYMSATPMTYSHEIKTLLQLMYIEVEQSKSDELLKRLINNKQIKESYRNSTEGSSTVNVEQLVNQCINLNITKELIMETFDGRISFIPELMNNMPDVIYKGVEYEAIKTLFIVPCYIQGDFKQYIQEHNQFIGSEWRKHLYLPTIKEDEKFSQFVDRQRDKQKSRDLSSMFSVQQEYLNPKRLTLTGKWMDLENLPNYCPKLAVMINELLRVQSKSFIFTNDIVEFGVELVISLLKHHGLLIMDQSPNQNSICFQCKVAYSKHELGHVFIPYRVVVVTGENSKAGETYLSKFNSVNNFINPAYHIVLGSIKLKEGYNLYGVNNVFILNIPYNVTNFIQVLGRAIRYKSHDRLAENNRYVNIHFLVTSIKGAQSLSRDEFKPSNKVSREELEIFTKMQDFTQVLQYERILNSMSIDIQYYHELYFKLEGNMQNAVVKSTNQLKALDFESTIESPRELDIYKDDLSTFYLLDLQHTVDQAITRRYTHCFLIRPVWLIDEMVDSICKKREMPNLSLLPRDIIVHKILLQTNVKQVGNYIVQHSEELDINLFFDKVQKPFILIGNEDFIAETVSMPQINKCFEYINAQFPKYIKCFDTRTFVDNKSQVQEEGTRALYNQIILAFGDISQQQLIDTYKSNLIKFNQNEDLEHSKRILACMNLIFPLLIDTSKNSIHGFVLNTVDIQIHLSNDQWGTRPLQQDNLNDHVVIVYPSLNNSQSNQIFMKHGSIRQKQGYRCTSKELVELQKLTNDNSQHKKVQCKLVTENALMNQFNSNLNFTEYIYAVFKFNV